MKNSTNIWLNRIYAFSLVVVFIFSMAFNGGDEVYRLMIISTIISVVSVLTLIAKNNRNQLFIPGLRTPATLLVAFVLWCLLSIYWTLDQQGTVVESSKLIIGLVVFYVSLHLSKKIVENIAIYFVLSCFVMGLYTTYLVFGEDIARATLFLRNINTYAAILVAALILTYAYAISNQAYSRQKVVLLIVYFLSIAIASTLSRGSFLALGVISALILISNAGNSVIRNRLVLMLFITSIGFVSVEVLKVSAISENNQSLLEKIEQTGSTVDARKIIWQSSIEIYKEYPYLGTGYGTFNKVYPQYRSQLDDTAGYHVHNDFLQTLVETGPIGLILLLLFFGVLLYPSLKKIATNRDSEDLSYRNIQSYIIIGLLVHAMFTFHLQQLSTTILILFLSGRVFYNEEVSSTAKQSNISAWVRSVTNHAFIILGLLFILSQSIFVLSYWYTESARTTLSSKIIERNLNKSIALTPYLVRPYLMKVEMYTKIIKETTSSKLHDEVFKKIESTLKRAKEISPLNHHIPYSLANAELEYNGLQVNDRLVMGLYKEALKLNPRYLPIRNSLYDYMVSSQQHTYNEACDILEDGLNRHYFQASLVIDEYLRNIINCRESLKPEKVEIIENQLKSLRDRLPERELWFIGLKITG
ncbi:MAG: O-antigen ligase family protein [Gammaproteobacteria bacterium]|nr:O-antigen ligase family protein [Gammaproteobacteria bacterium]